MYIPIMENQMEKKMENEMDTENSPLMRILLRTVTVWGNDPISKRPP